MKPEKGTITLVLLLSFLAMIGGALAGILLGGPSHPVAGALIGGTIGYIAPCLIADLVYRRLRASGKVASLSGQRTGLGLLLAAVATNEWTTPANLEVVQSIRGIHIAALIGVIAGTLIAWALIGTTFVALLSGALAGAAIGGLVAFSFEAKSLRR